MKLEYCIKDLTKYSNIRQVLKEEFILSDRLISKLKKLNQIYLNNEIIFTNKQLNLNDIVSVELDINETSDNIIPTKMKLDILYEDDCLLIINKSPNLPVHPSMDHFIDSLSNGVKYYFNSLGLTRKIRPINRLDKNTSGIVLFAKNAYIQECLIRQMKSGIFKKEYLAIVDGKVNINNKLTIDVPIARKENSIIERCVSDNGDQATTIIEVEKLFDDYTLIKCILKTGRTHQIRVHTQYIGHPILGDDLYGTKSNFINRQALHAYKVSFFHPILKNKIEIEAKLPEDMKKLIE